MKTTHGLVIFDYKGANPAIPNVHAFGFMQTEDDGAQDCNTEADGSSQFGDFRRAQELASVHWHQHFTHVVRNSVGYPEQHVFAYEPEALIHNLFTWGTDLALFDLTLPKEA